MLILDEVKARIPAKILAVNDFHKKEMAAAALVLLRLRERL